MPPVHLEMELAVPTVEEQSRLGRWKRAGAVDGGVVLRENDAAFEFGRARIGAIPQIDRGALGPKILPVLGGGAAGGLEIW
jgi:hypothetical protein